MKNLPLTHGTRAIKLRDILSSNTILVPDDPCPTLGERYTFAFYGRPSYRVDLGGGGLRRPTGAPCYIVLQPDILSQAVLAYPMDSGAFDGSKYREHVDRALQIFDFAFPATEEMLGKLVEYFFGSNENYMANIPSEGLNVPDGEDEAQAYYDLILSIAAGSGDERGSSIEICFDSDLQVNSHNILAVLIPDVLEPSAHYGEKLRSLGIQMLPYRFVRGYRADEYQKELYDALQAFYHSKGITS